MTPHEIKTFRFYQQWLSGQEEFLLHTSGSTGRPKPIRLQRAQMQASARLTGQALGLQAGDRALVCLSTDYIAGLMMLVRAFELDLDLLVVPPSSTPLVDLPDEATFEFTALVPMQLQKTLTDTPDKLPILNRMKAILIGGAPVSLSLQQQLQQIQAPVYHTYGMTETVSHIALRRLNGSQASDLFVPLSGVTTGLDERGCLTINSVLTNHQTLITNDRVELHADGAFRWLGRLDHVINSGGVKVQAEKVERAMATVLLSYQQGRLASRRFFAAPLPHAELGQQVVAIIEGSPLDKASESELRQALLEQNLLHKYELPRQFFYLPQLEETTTGKVNRSATVAQISAEKDEQS
ncbi:AMP-binding protein [Anaerolineales bacterium HSG25]|nr:AMP-binding protein [Anaerolineales bacterium HSG25]